MTTNFTIKIIILLLIPAMLCIEAFAQTSSKIAESAGYKLSSQQGILSKMNMRESNNLISDTSNYEFHRHHSEGINVPFSSVTDDAGNVYVTGTSSDFESVRGNFVTIKVDNSGTLIWEKRQLGTMYVAEFGMELALDADNNPVVSGVVWNGDDMDLLTMKYDAANGDILWQTIYTGDADGMDVPSAIAVASDGSIVVSGITYTGTNITWLTLKYNAQGTLLWSVIDANPLPDTWIEPAAIHIDNSGNIGVAGYNGNSGFWACYYTIVYSPEGTIRWSNLFEDPNHLNVNSMARDLTADANGNWYVTGTFDTYDPTMMTIKYSSEGVMLWADSVVMTEERSDGYTIMTGPSGQIYAAGRHFGGWVDDGTVLISYNPDGTRNWTEVTNDLIDVRPVKFTLDPAGNPVIAGWGTDPVTWNNIIKVLKYSSEGVVTGQVNYLQTSSEFGGFTEFINMAVDATDNTYLSFTGFYTNLGSVFEVMKIPFPTGNMEWDYIYSNGSASRTEMIAAYTDASNNTFVAARYDSITDNYLVTTYIVVKYNKNGVVEWEREFNEFNGNPANGIQIRVNDAGDVVVYLLPVSGGLVKMKKYNTSGNLMWEAEKMFINPVLYTFFFDGSDNIFLAGSAFENETDPFGKFVVVKFSSDGDELWTQYDIREGYSDESFTINDGTAGPSGDIFLTGSAGTGGWFDAESDMVVLKYDTDGELLWTQSLSQENMNTSGKGILVNEAGDIYINGHREDRVTYQQELVVARIQQNGEQVWVENYGQSGRRSMSYKLVQLSTGEIIVSAFSVIDGLNNKVILVKFDEEGNFLSVAETPYDRFFYDMYLDDADNLFVLNQVAGISYPFRPYYSVGAMPMGGLFTLRPDGSTKEQLFIGQELSDYYPTKLVPLQDGRLLIGGTLSNEFSMFQGLWFYESEHVVLSIGDQDIFEYSLAGQNCPNPTMGITEIPIFLERNSSITIKVFDLAGRIACTLYIGQMASGSHRVPVNVSTLEKGIYIYEVISDYRKQSFKMLIE